MTAFDTFIIELLETTRLSIIRLIYLMLRPLVSTKLTVLICEKILSALQAFVDDSAR